MKKWFFFLSITINTLSASAQQGIGISTASNHRSAIVDLSKSTKGLLIPRLTQLARTTINHPAEGLIVYDSTSNHFYQYQDGAWQFMLTNSYWSRSSLHNHMYSLDSIGIGTSSPDAQLEVNGNIRSRDSLFVENNLSAGGSLQGNVLLASANITALGTASMTGDIITQTGVSIDNGTNSFVQLKNIVQNKVFLQNSGNDLRLGTNTGNASGKTFIRMNGTDIISIDTLSALKVLVGGNAGNITIGTKVCRQMRANENMLPVFYGKINANGTIYWTSDAAPPDISGTPTTTVTKTGTGVYVIFTYSVRLSARAAFIISVGGTAPLTGTATFDQIGIFTVHIINPVTGNHADADFSFLVMDPYNLWD